MGRLEQALCRVPYTGQERKIWVFLPTGYDTNTTLYPVIYMQDGQNLFGNVEASVKKSWDIHKIMDYLVSSNQSQGAIVVGIENAKDQPISRLDEYSPWVNHAIKAGPFAAKITKDIGGHGEDYAEFVVQVVKPYVDRHFRTQSDREHTAIMGSAMGGLISIYMGLKYEHIFSKVGAFSTAIWFAEKELLRYIRYHSPELPMKWYLDIGTKEVTRRLDGFQDTARKGVYKVHDALLDVGIKDDCIRLVIDEGAAHDEIAWGKRFPNAFLWLFDDWNH